MEPSTLGIPAWQVFGGIGTCLIIAEIFLPGFIVLPIGVGFLAVVPIAMLTDSLTAQLIALVLAQLGVFLLLRKFRPRDSQPAVYSNAEGMLGQECEVIETVSASHPGYVKLYGDRWQAKTYSAIPLKKGARAVITRLDGNKVFIEELNATGEES